MSSRRRSTKAGVHGLLVIAMRAGVGSLVLLGSLAAVQFLPSSIDVGLAQRALVALYLVSYLVGYIVVATDAGWRRIQVERENRSLELSLTLPLSGWDQVSSRFEKAWLPLVNGMVGLGLPLVVLASLNPSTGQYQAGSEAVLNTTLLTLPQALGVMTSVFVLSAIGAVTGLLTSLQTYRTSISEAGSIVLGLWMFLLVGPLYMGTDLVLRLEPIYFLYGLAHDSAAMPNWSLIFWPQIPYALFTLVLLYLTSQEWTYVSVDGALKSSSSPAPTAARVSYRKPRWAQDPFVADTLNRLYRGAPAGGYLFGLFMLALITMPLGIVGALFVMALFFGWGFLQGSTAVRRDAVPARLEILSTVGMDPKAMMRGHWRGLTLVLRVGVWFFVGCSLLMMPMLSAGDPFTCVLQVGSPLFGGIVGAAVGLCTCYRIRLACPWQQATTT